MNGINIFFKYIFCIFVQIVGEYRLQVNYIIYFCIFFSDVYIIIFLLRLCCMIYFIDVCKILEVYVFIRQNILNEIRDFNV